MNTTIIENNVRPDFDMQINAIADYVLKQTITSELAYTTAYYAFLDSMACAFMALNVPACRQLLGPIVPGAILENGSKVPGTNYQLDPVQAAFNFGTMIRWLDFNDTWLAAEWGHPSDNLGAILMTADYRSRQRHLTVQPSLTIYDVYTAMIKAYEIQGVLALSNSFNQIGLDHVILVKVASTALTAALLGSGQAQMLNAISNAWIDGHSLRTYRHAPNTGSRKSWAAGDATSRGVWLALLAMRGEMGYPSALSAPHWGFNAVYFHNKPLELIQPLGSYVMENVLFKVSFPAEFHAQTAVECAIALHPHVVHRLNDIKKIEIETQQAGMRIINKHGPLYNPADRDHCLQYMIAIGLIYGELTAGHYDADTAANPMIDRLRSLMQVKENPNFSEDYLNPTKRSISNSLQIEFNDGSKTDKIMVEYPIGHRCRRQEAIPLLQQKFINAVNTHYTSEIAERILELCLDPKALAASTVTALTDLFTKPR